MSNLEAFLKHNIEDYLIHDLREMQRIEITYPLLMTTFAGIELLGALFSKSKFDTNRGHEYFRFYWNEYLYPGLPHKEAIGNQLYQLLRHGIAHAFLLKGSIFVGRSEPSDHLTKNADGILYVDAVRIADDFIASYNANVKPIVAVLEMSKRMDEIKAKFDEQAGKHDRSVFPLGTVATTAAVSHSLDPSSTTKP